MYYAETCIDGVWFCRGLPDAEWQQFSYRQLQDKLSELLAEKLR